MPARVRNPSPIADLRELASTAESIAREIDEAVATARRHGCGWPSIAFALQARSGLPLGQLFPGGISETTLRRMYER